MKSKSDFYKNYNEKIYFNYDTFEKNKSQCDEKERNTIIKESIIPDIAKEYLENDEYFKFKEEKQGEIPSNFLDKMRGSTVKVNLNVSNNYYNSNYNYYQEKNEKSQNDKKQLRKNSETTSKKTSQSSCNENVGSRLTVFIKNFFFGNETEKNINDSKLTIKSSNNLKTLISAGENKELLYIPCQNCNAMVKIEQIDSHSNVCVKVRLEVYQSEIENKDDAVNYKLKKFQENLTKIKSSSNLETNKENYYIDTLIQTVSDCLKIENASDQNYEQLNKLALNLELKGSVALQVLTERAKILVKEKIRTHKKEISSGILDPCKIKERLKQLKKAKDEKLNETRRLTIEKEFLQNKIKNFKSFPGEIIKCRQGTNLKPRNFKFLQSHLLRDKNENEIENEIENKIENEFDNEILLPRNSCWSNLSQHPRHIIDDIHSDVEEERTSQFSYKTEESSILSSNKPDLYKLDTTLDLTVDYQNGEAQEMRKSIITKPDPIEMKNLYREFVKLVLKVKFEVFNSNHPGQKISERILFNECLSKQITKNKFREFIINELNQPEKYLKCFKSVAKARKTKMNSNKPMEIINEESF